MTSDRLGTTGLMCVLMLLMAGYPILAASETPANAPGVPEQAKAADLKAQEARSTTDAEARKAKFREALDLAATAMDTTPDKEWDRLEFQRYLSSAYRWLSELPQADLESWLAANGQKLKSPNGQVVIGGVEWKAGRQTPALARVANILSAAPDSLAAELAIQAMVGIHFFRGDQRSLEKAVESTIRIAPNNRSAGWALCCRTWKHSSDKNPERAYDENRRVIESRPGTLAADVAGKLNKALEAIDEADYKTAVDIFTSFPEYYFRETIPDHLIDTFVISIDFKNPEKAAPAADKLVAAMRETAEKHANEHVRNCAKCVIARVYEKQGRTAEAVAVLKEVLDAQQGPLKPLEVYTLTRLADIAQAHEPKVAIEYLERFRSGYGKVLGAEHNLTRLGRLYLRTGQPDKAAEVLTALDNECKRGNMILSITAKRGLQEALADSVKAANRTEQTTAAPNSAE